MKQTIPMPQKDLPIAVSENLQETIISNNMQPGDRFYSESELIEMFGVSRSTIREAVKLLVADNIVEIRRGKGTFIAHRPGIRKDPLGLNFTDQQKLLQNLLETRMMVEPQVAYLAALRATDKDICMLEEVIVQMQETPNLQEVHASLDIKFHSVVAQCTQNDVLHRFLPIICESIREGYSETVTIEGSQKRAMESHVKIFQAIKNRQPEKAKQETEWHIVSTAKDANLRVHSYNK